MDEGAFVDYPDNVYNFNPEDVFDPNGPRTAASLVGKLVADTNKELRFPPP